MDETYIIANRTDVGAVREVNEDSMVTFDSPNGRVIAVCDGMGGQAAGDVASRLACDIITDILTNNRFGTPTEAITRACIAANQGIIHRAAQNPNLEGMGATCVIVIIKDGLVYYGWIGDSRIYYISNGTIRQLTRDQSYVQQLVDQGQLTAAEAENHPQKNQILNALGLPSMTPPELCTAPLSPEPGSIVLLCSDGLSGMVDDNTIQNIASQNDIPLQKRADMLVDRAIANGGSDNITVQLIQFGKAKGAAGAGKQKSNMMLYGIIGAAIIVAAIVLACVFFGPESKEEGPTTAPVNMESPTTPKVKKETRERQAPKETPKHQTKGKETKKNNTPIKGVDKDKTKGKKEKAKDKVEEFKNPGANIEPPKDSEPNLDQK